MRRRNHMRGCLLLGFGAGLLIGQCLESWFLCTGGGLVLLIIGCLSLCQK